MFPEKEKLWTPVPPLDITAVHPYDSCGVQPSVLITVWLPCCVSCESLCVSASLRSSYIFFCRAMFMLLLAQQPL